MLYLIALPVVFLVASVIIANRFVKKGKSPRRVLATQMLSLFAVCFICLFTTISFSASEDNNTPNSVQTSGAVATSETSGQSAASGMGFLAVSLATGLAIIGAGIAVAAAAPAAIAATAEDPKSFGKSIVFVGMAEGLSVLGLIISIMLLQKL